MSGDPIFDTAQAIWDEVVDIFATAAVVLPSRQYIQHGQVAHDCAELVVEIGVVRPGPATTQEIQLTRGGRVLRRSCTYKVWLVRECAPTMQNTQFPSPSSLTAAAESLATDGWTLFSGLRSRVADSNFLGNCGEVFVGNMLPFGPQGLTEGWVLDIAVEV